MKLRILTAMAATALMMIDAGRTLCALAEALENRMDAWREQWGYTAEEVHAPFWKDNAEAQD